MVFQFIRLYCIFGSQIHPPKHNFNMKSTLLTLFVAFICFGLSACGNSKKAVAGQNTSERQETMNSKDNTLTKKQKKEGWKLLFDGNSTDGWHTFNEDNVSAKWSAKNGVLIFDPEVKSKGGDLVTNKEYSNFHLKLDWKISACGNSGIMFNIQENGQEKTYHTGPEMQILDNTCHGDAKYPTHRAGSLYDLIQAQPETENPAGEWNTVDIILDQGHLVFKLNGTQVVETQMFNDQWTEMLANSKFKRWPGFGTFKKGHIGLQDHGDYVEFKNIMIKEL